MNVSCDVSLSNLPQETTSELVIVSNELAIFFTVQMIIFEVTRDIGVVAWELVTV